MPRLPSFLALSKFIVEASLVIALISLMCLVAALMAIGFSTIATEYRFAAFAFSGVIAGFTFAMAADWVTHRV